MDEDGHPAKNDWRPKCSAMHNDCDEDMLNRQPDRLFRENAQRIKEEAYRIPNVYGLYPP